MKKVCVPKQELVLEVPSWRKLTGQNAARLFPLKKKLSLNLYFFFCFHCARRTFFSLNLKKWRDCLNPGFVFLIRVRNRSRFVRQIAGPALCIVLSATITSAFSPQKNCRGREMTFLALAVHKMCCSSLGQGTFYSSIGAVWNVQPIVWWENTHSHVPQKKQRILFPFFSAHKTHFHESCGRKVKFFRPSATVSRIGLMESHVHHHHRHHRGGPPPPGYPPKVAHNDAGSLMESCLSCCHGGPPLAGWPTPPPPTWWMVGALGLYAD